MRLELRGALWITAVLLIGQFSVKALAGGDDLDARDAAGETPLHRAVEKGMHGLAQDLIRRWRSSCSPRAPMQTRATGMANRC